MRLQRLAAFAMIAVEVAAIEYMLFLYEWYPVVIAAVALAATPGLIRLPVGRNGRIVGAVALGLFIYAGMYTNLLTFLVAHRLPLDPILGGNALVVAWYLITLQSAILFLRTKDDRLPLYFPVMGVIVMACAGAVGRHGSLDPLFHVASLGFVALIVLFMASGRPRIGTHRDRKGQLLQAAILALSLVASFAVSSVMGVYRSEIDNAVFAIVPGILGNTTVGFSTRARLDSIARLRDSDAIALRAVARTAPGYLRGRAYDHYANDSWDVTVSERVLEPLREVPFGAGADKDTKLFRLRDGDESYTTLRILPMVNAEGCLFAPLQATLLALYGATPALDGNGNLKAPGAAPPEYTLYGSRAPVNGPLADDARARLLALPDNLDPRVRDLAARLFAQAHTSREKIAAVLAYFNANYSYQLGIEVPRGQDPLTYFLLDQPPAHCEYFATGAAILLRLGGVPCRYVTGFVATEQNSIGRYWIARSRDAHAWVEAFDDESNAWLTVEPTVADGVPGHEQQRWTRVFAHLTDAIRYAFQRLALAVVTGRWQELLRESVVRLFQWVLSPAGMLLVILVAGYLLIRRYRRKSKLATPKREDPNAAALIRLRKTVDRTIRRLGFTRRPEETVHAFADRIASSVEYSNETSETDRLRHAVAWYRTYCKVRFRGPITPDRVQQLRREWLQTPSHPDQPRCAT